MIHCDRCHMRAGEARTFEIAKCCDYGEYLLELVDRSTEKKNSQLKWGSNGNLFQESSYGIGKLSKRDWRKMYRK